MTIPATAASRLIQLARVSAAGAGEVFSASAAAANNRGRLFDNSRRVIGIAAFDNVRANRACKRRSAINIRA